jgi:hypothetical protein
LEKLLVSKDRYKMLEADPIAIPYPPEHAVILKSNYVSRKRNIFEDQEMQNAGKHQQEDEQFVISQSFFQHSLPLSESDG